MIGLRLQLHISVAQVVGSAQQIQRTAVLRAMPHHHQGLRGSLYADQTAIFSDQHVAAPHHRAVRQKDGQSAALAVSGVKAAFLAHTPI